jgi:uncharacterized protein YjcR
MSHDKSSAESSNLPVVLTAARIRAAKGLALLDAGMPATEVAAKMGVSQQRVHQWKYERASRQSRGGKEQKAAEPKKVAFHESRMAQKVQRGAIQMMQTEGATDFLVDVILLTKAMLE